MKFIQAFVLVLCGLALAGCAAEAVVTPIPEFEPTGQAIDRPRLTQAPGASDVLPGDVTVLPDATPRPDQALLLGLVQKARADLAQKSGRAPDEIKLLEAAPVIWPDASLGCPQKGVMYIAVESPGFRIVLELDGRTFIYHTNQVERVVSCAAEVLPDAALPDIPLTPGSIMDGKPWMPVK